MRYKKNHQKQHAAAWILGAGVAGVMVFGTASAQVVQGGQLPASSDPSLIQRRFDEPVRPRITPEKVEQEGLGQESSSADSSERFTLNQVAFEGVSVYQEADLHALYDSYLGKKVTLADVQQIAQTLTKKYRADGYMLSRAVIPPQRVRNGAVTVRVIEGYIANVRIDGDYDAARDRRELLSALAQKVTQERPITVSTLERYLLLIDDLPGVTAKGVVRPSQAAPGAAELVVLVQQKMIDASASVNNRGTRFIGRTQYGATVAGNSILGLYDRTLLRAITATPTSELRFFDLQHEEQLGTEGTKLVTTIGHTRTEPGDSLKPLNIVGRSTNVEIEVNHPLIRSRQMNLVPRVAFNYRNSDTDVLGLDFTKDRLRVGRLGTRFDIADKWDGSNLFDVELSRGFDFLGATDRKGINRSRQDADSEFTKLLFNASRLQPLPAGFSFLTAAAAQYAFDPLLAPEEFTLGGLGFGQAYDPSELGGDHGAAIKLELRYGQAVEAKYLESYQLYTYYDLGAVWQEDRLIGTPSRQSLADVGVGIRTNFTPWLSGTLELGVPLTRDVSAENERHPRLFFGMTGRF